MSLTKQEIAGFTRTYGKKTLKNDEKRHRSDSQCSSCSIWLMHSWHWFRVQSRVRTILHLVFVRDLPCDLSN